MTQLIVRKEDLLHNLSVVREAIGTTRLIAVVKGNGYGLGLLPYTAALRDAGVDFFAVYTIDEAETLRNAGFVCDILVLGCFPAPAESARLVAGDFIATVGSVDSVRSLQAAAEAQEKPARCHIEFDIGLGRSGVMPHVRSQFLDYLRLNKPLDFVLERQYAFYSAAAGKKFTEIQEELAAFEKDVLPTGLSVEGVYAHFSCGYGKNLAKIRKELALFEDSLSWLAMPNLPRHVCASGTLFRMPETHLDAVRVGSALTGRVAGAQTHGLRPLGVLQTTIAEVRRVPKGTTFGYAGRSAAKRELEVAVIPVGYADGLGLRRTEDAFSLADVFRAVRSHLRQRKHPLTVTVKGQAVPLLGRVGMTNCLADVTGLKAAAGDTVTLPCNPILTRNVQWLTDG